MKKHIILFIIGLVIIFSKANAGLKYGPYLSQVTKTSVAITWITDNDSGNNKVLWGTGTPVNEVLQSSSDYNNLHNLLFPAVI